MFIKNVLNMNLTVDLKIDQVLMLGAFLNAFESPE